MKGLKLKEQINTKAFIGFVVSMLWYMWLLTIIDATVIKWYITAYMVFLAGMMITGTDKGSVFELGNKLMRILLDPKLTNEEKLGMLMSIIKDWLGVAANLSMIIDVERRSTDAESKPKSFNKFKKV